MKRHHGISLASAALGALTFSLGISLVACGSDSSSSNDDNKDSNGIAEYETLDEMVHCTKSHYGEIAHVAETDSIYECTSDGWVVADSSKIEELLSSSDSKTDGKSSDSKSEGKSSSSIAASAEDTAKVETVKVDSVAVLGLAEKGPFAKGSVVNVYGLDSALNKTKTSFKGAVNDEKGNYSVSKIKLSSQYAMVEVNGFFNNEVTGKVTSGSKTKLRALVDLSEGDTVKANVNVLTDLEYERAIALVKKEKYNVPAAKIRATKEILSAFGVAADSVTATKLSLMGKDAATDGLLAASVAVMGNLSLSKFQARLSDVAESFAATGSIGDTLRAEIADGLSLLDSNGTLAVAMKNIKTLNSKATDVDSLLYAFWSDNYKLPACDAKAEETIAKNGNKLSSYYGSGYACTSNRWHKSTALDTELGLCVAKSEGKYESTKAGKFYTCKAGQWREITKDQYELGACTEDIAKDASKKYKAVGGEYYLCKDLQWEVITATEFELKDCDADKNETLVVTKTTKESFVCLDGEWRKATAQEEAFGYCGKVDSTTFKTLEEKNYVCLENGWTEVSDLIAELGFCTAKNAGKFDKAESQDYHCDGNVWTEVTALEAELGLCADSTSAKWKQSGAGDYYNCSEKQWTAVTKEAFNFRQICNKTINGTFEKYGETDYVCDGDAWRKLSDVENKFGYCKPSMKDSVVWTGLSTDIDLLSKPLPDSLDKNGQFLVCNGDKWVGAQRVDYLYGICNEAQQGVYKNFYSVYSEPISEYVITPQVLSTSQEAVRSIYMDQSDFVYAKCEDGKWKPTTYVELVMGKKNESCIDGNKERRVTYSEGTFSCFQGKWYETIKDSRDDHVYRITTIGNQTWMAENLNYAYKGVKFNYSGHTSDSTSWCYDNLASNCDRYGRLYIWSAAMDSAAQFSVNAGTKCGLGKTCTPNSPHRGICPTGWHVPTHEEFNALYSYVGGAGGAGRLLKSTNGWHNDGNGVDKYGFTLYPAGYMYLNDDFRNMDYHAYLLSATEYDDRVRIHTAYYGSGNVNISGYNKNTGHSLRCLKD